MEILVKRDLNRAMMHHLQIGAHEWVTDLSKAEGGEDLGPDAHDLFDASLAACKAMTLLWYAKRRVIPLEDLEVRVTRDDSEERKGKYRLRAEIQLKGPLTQEQKDDLLFISGRCPIQKLMTQSEIEVNTVLREASGAV